MPLVLMVQILKTLLTAATADHKVKLSLIREADMRKRRGSDTKQNRATANSYKAYKNYREETKLKKDGPILESHESL